MRLSRRLFRYIRPYAWALGLTMLLVAVVGLLEAASPFLIGLVFDSMFGGSATPTVAIPFVRIPFSTAPSQGPWFLAALVLLTIVKAGAEYAAVNLTAFLGHSVVRDLRNDLYERLLRQPLRFFHHASTGELISRVSADVDRIQTAASETLAEFLKQSAILLFLLIAVFAIDWKLASVSILLLPLISYPAVWFGRKLRTLGRSNQEELAGMANILFESFAGNRIVKAFTMEREEIARFRRATHQVFRINVIQKLTHTLSSPLMEVLGIGVVAVLILYARAQIIGQRMTLGVFLAFVISMIKLYDPVRRMSGIYNSFQQAIGASDRIFELMHLEVEKAAVGGPLAGLDREIRFENVTFAYGQDASVLRDVSFAVGKGEVVAIVGPSGAGKSTLVDLIPRFHDPQSGRITIDDRDVRGIALSALRKRIAMVTQEVILFNDTIRANIAYGDPEASDDAVMRAARAALVDEFVRDLPQGYETMVGERGLRLSGGERQRISIARALLRNAPILILDEATSSLDTQAELLVQKALQNLMEGRTTIVIAHRLSTVRRADRIIVIEDGAVREVGTHQELLTHRGLYWKLHNLQFQDVSS